MTAPSETLLLTASELARCLSADDCREAVEHAFLALGRGEDVAYRSLGFEAPGGSFHVKSALRRDGHARLVAKLNANFPGNPRERGLPTIQGVALLVDASDGRILALMDSGMLTALRTAAASALAADRLARRGASVGAIVGCGLQGRAHAEALLALGRLREVRLFDVEPERARRLAEEMADRGAVTFHVAGSVREASLGAHVVATCTSGADYVLGVEDADPGTFVAAVGADNPHKREIGPELMRRARIVVDDLAQCAAGGDLHHAIAAGLVRPEDVHADLASVVAGLRPGRVADDEIVVFDSTGIAIEDLAAADRAYERARALGLGRAIDFRS